MEASIEKINYTVFTQIKINVIQKTVFLKTFLPLNITFGHEFVSMKIWITANKNVRHATVPPTKLLPALSASKMLSLTLIEAAEKSCREKKKKEVVQQKESKRKKGLRDRPDVSFV